MAFRSVRPFRLVGWFALVVLASCQTTDPVTVQPSFTTSPALAVRRPADVAVLPIEDASPGGAAARHLTFLRQEIMRQLVERNYTPLTAKTVDAAMKGNADLAEARTSGRSILEPAVAQKLAGHSTEEAMFLLRIDEWDESRLLSAKRLTFRCQAALVANDGQQLWSGSLGGELKAGGVGAAPRDRDAMARSCGEMLVRELMVRLPLRQP
ncbi:MAG: hypothetical protein FJ265_01540 [Planctomycetes bacterium]|nr:hypothetical protein [Planctomycetota bacterium]